MVFLVNVNKYATCFVHFFRILESCWPSAQVRKTIMFLLVTLPNIHRFKKKFTHTLSN